MISRRYPGIIHKGEGSKSLPPVIGACLITLALLAFMTPAANGAGFGMIRKSPEEIVSNMKERLSLSNDQQARVQPIIAKFVRQRDEILEKRSGFGRGKRRAVKDRLIAIKRETDRQLATVLTQSQMQTYLKEQQEARDNWRAEHGRERRGPGSRAAAVSP
ncbi:MAG: hypothetical protein AB9866_17535 [Syntrophobacteraceae bacterium]